MSNKIRNQFEDVPNALKELKQWAVLRYEVNETGNRKQVPCDSSGNTIDIKAPKNLMTFDETVAFLDSNGHCYSGIGFIRSDGWEPWENEVAQASVTATPEEPDPEAPIGVESLKQRERDEARMAELRRQSAMRMASLPKEDVLFQFLRQYLVEEAGEGRKERKKRQQDFDDKVFKNLLRRVARSFTDLGNAYRIVDAYGDIVCYCPDKQDWLIWNDKYWEVDRTEHVRFLIEQRLSDLKREIRDQYERGAASIPDTKRSMLLFEITEEFIEKSQQNARLEAAEKIARHQPELVIRNNELDQEKFLLNVANGTVNLRTGKLQPYSREDFITRITNLDYDPEASCPTWLRFLSEVMDDNQELVEYLQRIIGYALTGDITEQKVFIFYGTGSNGKSTFIETIHALMEDYSTATKFSAFTEQGDHALTMLAKLDKVRLVTASESRAEVALAEDLLKEITGGEAVTAKALYKNPFTFYPEFKLILSANNRPNVKQQDHGTWRRIRLVPFEVTIPEEDQNKELPNLLREELPGILAWAVQGAIAWVKDRQDGKDGLKTPAIVLEATEEYKESMDVIGDFLKEKFCFYENYRIEEKEIHKIYQEWCRANDERYPYGKSNLYRMIEERGYPRKSSNGKKWFLGLKSKMGVVADLGERYRQEREGNQLA